MAVTAKEFGEGRHAFVDELIRRGTRGGPKYMPNGHVIIWHDQYFEMEIDPVGSVICHQAIRVGKTLSHLDVVLLASHANETPLVIPAGSEITLTLMQGDAEDGTYEDVGPSVCIKAPAGGLEIDPDELVFRFPIGDFLKPWLRVNLEFAGAITGGKLDCALGYIPH